MLLYPGCSPPMCFMVRFMCSDSLLLNPAGSQLYVLEKAAPADDKESCCWNTAILGAAAPGSTSEMLQHREGTDSRDTLRW